MLIHGTRPDTPSSPVPPGEGRHVSNAPTVRPSVPGLGPPERPDSFYESRVARVRRNEYSHDQSGGQTWRNDGSHVRVARANPFPTGQHDATLQPQRPTFRTPPGTWTDSIIDRS